MDDPLISLESPPSPLEIQGTPEAEKLTGGFGDDTIYGNGGNDEIDGQAGSDEIYGGEGDDVIIGNFGDDTLYGEAGNDTISDDQGENFIDGGEGDDTLSSRSLSGNHTLIGGFGQDNISGTGETLYIDGGEGNDNLNIYGYVQNEGVNNYLISGEAIVLAGEGNDNITADNFMNVNVRGGEGDDYFNGYGYTQFRNRQSPEQGNGVFRDSGSFFKFRSALEYHFADSFSMVLSPSFEQGFYDIKASPNLIENFETASFFTLSLGVRYHVDNLSNAQRSRQIITEDQELKDLLSRDHDDLSISEKRRKYFLLKKQKRINRRNARRSNLP